MTLKGLLNMLGLFDHYVGAYNMSASNVKFVNGNNRELTLEKISIKYPYKKNEHIEFKLTYK